jgi:S-formylglutathione hydrolase FrmB
MNSTTEPPIEPMQKPAIATSVSLLFLVIVVVATAEAVFLQSAAKTTGRNVQLVKFESRALSGSLLGEPSTREIAVGLPPSYNTDRKRRYPVVYLLHGLRKRSDGHLETSYMFPALMNEMKEGKLGEMILVAIDGSTRLGGSYYTNSPATGNFEDYIVKEIVLLVDSVFRTRAMREWRAIAGFSMGGFGALKIAMKHPAMFSQVGSLSGSPMSMRFRKPIYRRALLNQRRPATLEQLLEEVTYENSWSLAAAYAKAAVFSPNPDRPPLYLDLPFEDGGSDDDDETWQRWLAEDPLSLVPQYQKNLRALDQIYMDHGDDETTLGTEDFDRELVRYSIGHNHYIYRGDHVDKLPDRYLRMLRFFAARWAYQ